MPPEKVREISVDFPAMEERYYQVILVPFCNTSTVPCTYKEVWDYTVNRDFPLTEVQSYFTSSIALVIGTDMIFFV